MSGAENSRRASRSQASSRDHRWDRRVHNPGPAGRDRRASGAAGGDSLGARAWQPGGGHFGAAEEPRL